MPTTNLGRIGFVLQGDWSAGTHKFLDVVSHNNAVWGCAQATTTDEPAPGSDWIKLVDASGFTFASQSEALAGTSNTVMMSPLAAGYVFDTLSGGVFGAVSDIGVLAKEIDAQRFTRHQQGTITLYNRGVKSGCALTKSGTATRNVNIASGVVFRSGRTWGVDEQINGASVQNNNTAESATCQAYLDADMDLLITDLGVAAPNDGLVLATITVPAGSNNSTDPNLASCTITPVARQEPEWPGIQLSETYEDVSFDRVMSEIGYQVSLDPVSWEGGERPVLVTEESERATNAFRVTLGGMADTVKINYMAHLMAM
jgi:hypothetical protein